MSWDWVPPRDGEDARGGPSRRLRLTVTVLTVLLTAVLAGFYLTRYVDSAENRCRANRPAGVSVFEVRTGWRWWPPGVECTYPDSGTSPVGAHGETA